MNYYDSPDRSRMGPIHSSTDLKEARDLSRSAMDTWIEILRKRDLRGFGKTPNDFIRGGRVAAGIQQGTRGRETEVPNYGVDSSFEWEFIVSSSVAIDKNCRVAWPAYSPLYAIGQYSAGKMVAPSNWIKGTSPIFRCARGGQTGLKEPQWTFDLGSTTQDGGVLWELIGWATLFEVIGVAVAQSHPTQKVIRALET